MIAIPPPSLPLTYAEEKRKEKNILSRGLWRTHFNNRGFALLLPEQRHNQLERTPSFCFAKPYFSRSFSQNPSPENPTQQCSLNTENTNWTLESVDWCYCQQSFLTGLSKWQGKIICSKTQVLKWLQMHLTASNASWWQLGVPGELTGKTWILFLVERAQNSTTVSMCMPSDCSQAWRGTLTCFYVYIQKPLLCFPYSSWRWAPALLYNWMSVPGQSPDILYWAVWI